VAREKFDAEKKAAFLDLLRKGNTLTACAAAVGVSIWTVLRHQAKRPAFNRDVLAARKTAFVQVEDALFVEAMNGDVQAQLAFLRTRSRQMQLPAEERWEDVSKVQHTGGDPDSDAPVKIEWVEIADAGPA
jgi:hypothetical protein